MKAVKIIRRVCAVLLTLIVCLLGAATAVAVPLANNYANMVSMALGQSSYEKKGGANPQYYESAYETEEELAEEAKELCRNVEEEGMVLLKNEEGTLPLEKGMKISLLSQNSVDLVYGGAGAGSVDTSLAPNLKTAMEAAGFEVNTVLWDFYESGAGVEYRKEVPSLTGQGKLAAHEVPQEVYTQDVISSFSEYGDVGVIVIGRSGSESVDLPAEYLEFTQEERDLIEMAQNTFEKVVLLLNVTNAMNLSVLEEYDIDACLWIGALGQEGAYAVGEALNGSVNPSGHLTDTWVYDAMSAPATANLGDYTISNSEVTSGNKYLVYAEGIYVGYRYYETRYEDVVLGNESEENYSYGNTVQFPFGYGLSYTDFVWSDYTVDESGESFSISVTVTNTGDTAGKDTVQIYIQNPYTEYDRQNAIEKSAVELAGYEKTGLLAPGESETVTVKVNKDILKTYDAKGYETYILEEGEYFISAGRDAHDALNHILAAKGSTVTQGMTAEGNSAFAYSYVQEETDTVTYASGENGVKITNQLSDVDISGYDEDFTYLSRSNWMDTWPVTYKNGSWEAPQELLEDLEIVKIEEADAELSEGGVISEEYGELKLIDLKGADFDDERWEALLNQMSAEEIWDLIRQAGYGTKAVESIGLPGVVHKDGPAGISSTLAGGAQKCMAYPPAVVLASSWNKELAAARGEMVGEDSISSGITVWYAPAMNIHRAAISGRNFEYYSEDSYLSGTMGAAESAGYESKGGIVTIKHFALNDQEMNRAGGAVFTNEQTARQLYLSPFEKSVTEGNASGIMSSMNRIGARWIGGHEGLMTNILRGEWGYDGFVITDQASFSSFDYCDIREGLAAGNDLWLNTANNRWILPEGELTPTILSYARTAAHRYLYTVANSNAMNGVDRDTIVLNVKADWQKLIMPLVIVMIFIVAVGLFGSYKLWGFRKKSGITRK